MEDNKTAGQETRRHTCEGRGGDLKLNKLPVPYVDIPQKSQYVPEWIYGL
jgi:hypothetical protein